MTSEHPQPALSPVTDEDTAFLLDLYASTVEDTVGALGWSTAQITEFVAMQSDMQLQGYRQSHPLAEHYVVSVDGTPVGRLIVEWTDDAVFLVDIVIRTSSRSAGLGSALIRSLQQSASERLVPIRLNVRIDNTRAALLYQRLGFIDELANTSGNSLYRSMQWTPPNLLGEDR